MNAPDPAPDTVVGATGLLATAVLRRLGREHRPTHPATSGELPFDVAIGDQTDVLPNAAARRRSPESPP